MAELTGIKYAIEEIPLLHRQNPHIKTFNILCDCKCAVNYIKCTYHLKRHYATIVQQIREALTNLAEEPFRIKIHWVPGHANNYWNDLADELAKSAARSWHLLGNQAPLGTPSAQNPPPRG